MPKEKPITKKLLTKRRFERLLMKVFTSPKDAQEAKRTSVARPSDGCSGTSKSQDKTEGIGG